MLIAKLQKIIEKEDDDLLDKLKLAEKCEFREMKNLMKKVAILEFVGSNCTKEDKKQYDEKINQIEVGIKNCLFNNENIGDLLSSQETDKYSFLMNNKKILEELLAKISAIRLAAEKFSVEADKNSMLLLADSLQKQVVNFFLSENRDLFALKSKCEGIAQGLVNYKDDNI